MTKVFSQSLSANKSKLAIWRLIALSSGIVALVSYRYLFGFGPIPPTILANRYFHGWVVVHASSAATALLTGPLQFLRSLRQGRPRLHRISGRIYLAACMIGGISAMALAIGTSAGAVASAGFIGLGVAWISATLIALGHIVHGHIAPHRRWMIRSFALTCSAVTLRIYLFTSGVMKIEYQVAYPLIAWACWVPNVLLAQWYLHSTWQKRIL